jgi:hypothetical protein
VPLEHDVYLKLWHLAGARLPARAAVLYVDEAQDANPVTLAILEAQRRPTVWVGDPWQSIYRFRGSVNAMRMITSPLDLVIGWACSRLQAAAQRDGIGFAPDQQDRIVRRLNALGQQERVEHLPLALPGRARRCS